MSQAQAGERLCELCDHPVTPRTQLPPYRVGEWYGLRSTKALLQPTSRLSDLQVPPAVNVSFDPLLAFFRGAALVPGHKIDLCAEDPARLCLDLFLCDLRHGDEITGGLRPRQTRASRSRW